MQPNNKAPKLAKGLDPGSVESEHILDQMLAYGVNGWLEISHGSLSMFIVLMMYSYK